MMSTESVKTLYTPEEYIALEREGEFRHEYVDGELRLMPGASRAHNLIVANISRVVGNQLVDRPCEVYITDMRTNVDPGFYSYPDVVVVCQDPEFLDRHFDTLTNPTVLIEVLSPSTQSWDRGGKRDRYLRLESLREYVLVSQDRFRVERLARDGDDWSATVVQDLNDVLRLESIDCEVSLRDIYAKTQLLLASKAADE